MATHTLMSHTMMSMITRSLYLSSLNLFMVRFKVPILKKKDILAEAPSSKYFHRIESPLYFIPHEYRC